LTIVVEVFKGCPARNGEDHFRALPHMQGVDRAWIFDNVIPRPCNPVVSILLDTVIHAKNATEQHEVKGSDEEASSSPPNEKLVSQNHVEEARGEGHLVQI
jgi:hypothetical protein